MHEIMGWKKFGRQLIKTGDLDPVYLMLANSYLDRDAKARYCLALLLYSHEGVAAKLTARAPAKFFDYALKILPDTPRGGVRRHFRGEKARDAILHMQKVSHNRPEWLVDFFFGNSTNKKARTSLAAAMPYSEVSKRVLSIPQMGKWAAFKMADMGDRLLGYRVDFTGCEGEMQKPCLKGAAAILYDDTNAPISAREVRKVAARLQRYFANTPAPPDLERNVNLAEIETILCKYSKHFAGRYPMGKDAKVVHDELEGYGKLARHLQSEVKQLKAWRMK